MTTEPIHFDRAEKEPDEDDGRLVPFTLDDDPTIYMARKPKTAYLLMMAQVDERNAMAVAAMTLQLLDKMFEADTTAAIRARLDDDEDEFDVEDILPVVEVCMSQWFGRPTKRRSGSAGSPSRSGRRSTVRQPSKASTP